MRQSKSVPFFLFAALLIAFAGVATAERGDDSNRKSKNGLTEGTIDGVGVTLEYGRPSVRGRSVWGDLVPYGKVWRTGADEATTISLDADANIEGQALGAGTYSVFTIPSPESWTIIFNRKADQWGAFEYDPSQDALRVEVEPAASEHVENLDFVIEGQQVVLRWGELAVPFEISRR